MSYIEALNVTGIKERKNIHERIILMPYRRNKKQTFLLASDFKKNINVNKNLKRCNLRRIFMTKEHKNGMKEAKRNIQNIQLSSFN